MPAFVVGVAADSASADAGRWVAPFGQKQRAHRVVDELLELPDVRLEELDRLDVEVSHLRHPHWLQRQAGRKRARKIQTKIHTPHVPNEMKK